MELVLRCKESAIYYYFIRLFLCSMDNCRVFNFCSTQCLLYLLQRSEPQQSGWYLENRSQEAAPFNRVESFVLGLHESHHQFTYIQTFCQICLRPMLHFSVQWVKICHTFTIILNHPPRRWISIFIKLEHYQPSLLNSAMLIV